MGEQAPDSGLGPLWAPATLLACRARMFIPSHISLDELPSARYCLSGRFHKSSPNGLLPGVACLGCFC